MQVLYGDVDGDGIVDSRDATLILGYIQSNASPIAAIFLDINGDGVVNMSDYTTVHGLLGQIV